MIVSAFNQTPQTTTNKRKGDLTMKAKACVRVVLVLVAMLTVMPAMAQITGTQGSPNATTTIDGRYLSPPPHPFAGEIKLNATQLKPYWPTRKPNR